MFSFLILLGYVDSWSNSLMVLKRHKREREEKERKKNKEMVTERGQVRTWNEKSCRSTGYEEN